MFPHPVAHNQTIAPRVSAVPYRPRRAANDKVEKSGGTGPLAQWRKARFTLICQRVTVRQGGAPLGAMAQPVSATLRRRIAPRGRAWPPSPHHPPSGEDAVAADRELEEFDHEQFGRRPDETAADGGPQVP